MEGSDDEVFMEKATLSFLLSSSKMIALDKDAVKDDQATPGRDCLPVMENVPENKDDLGGEQGSKDDRGSSWTDEDSFERLVDEYEEDSTPQEVEGLSSPPGILTTKQDDQDGSDMVNDQHRPCAAPVMSSQDDPLSGGLTVSYTGLEGINGIDDERPFADKVIPPLLSVERMMNDEPKDSTVPDDDQEVGQDVEDTVDDQDGGCEGDVETTATPVPSVGTTVSVQRYTGKDIHVTVNDTLCAASPLAPGTESGHEDPSPTTHGSPITPASHPNTPGNSTTQGSKDDISSSRADDEADPVVRKNPVKCVYWKGGVCVHHGPGAKRKWRPKGTKIEIDKDGVAKKVINKEYFYVCGPETRRRGKQQQTVLSFRTTTTTQGQNNTLVFGTVADDDIRPSVGK